MEDYKTLIEVVTELIDRGYLIDFSPMENIVQGIQKAHTLNIPPADFMIDEIYCCEDENDKMVATYVFAISSKNHKFKGIVINALTDNYSATFSGIASLIKNRFFKTLYSFNTKFKKI